MRTNEYFNEGEKMGGITDVSLVIQCLLSVKQFHSMIDFKLTKPIILKTTPTLLHTSNSFAVFTAPVEDFM